jgi:hypothetical protein
MGNPKKQPDRYKSVKAAKVKHEKEIMKRKNVVGVGVGHRMTHGSPTEELCIRVYVEKKLPKSKLSKADLIPSKFGSVRTDIVEVGKIIQYGYTGKHRPAHGGDSIGHFNISAGTLGYLFRDKTDGSTVVLSNNHILANRDTNLTTKANVGDCITQPGPVDGGTCASDRIATLKRWVPWIEGGDTKVDAAIAEVVNPSDVVSNIHGIGCIDSWRSVTDADVVSDASDPDNVQKTGRTTDYTTGKIIDVDATFSNGVTNLTENIVTNDMGAPGDSGSILTDMDGKALGLLWGGSPGSIVIYSGIENVLDALKIEFFRCFRVECYFGPAPRCLIGGPKTEILCKTGGPRILECVIGGPKTPLCPGGPRIPFCNGGPKFPICLACGPDSPIGCGIGGADFVVDISKCGAGPYLDISIIDERINPQDLVVIDKSQLPQGMQRSLIKMLETMAKEK